MGISDDLSLVDLFDEADAVLHARLDAPTVGEIEGETDDAVFLGSDTSILKIYRGDDLSLRGDFHMLGNGWSGRDEGRSDNDDERGEYAKEETGTGLRVRDHRERIKRICVQYAVELTKGQERRVYNYK